MPISSSSQPTLRVLLESCEPKALFSDLALLGVNSEWLFLKGYKPSPATLRKTPVQARLIQAMLKEPPLLMAFLKWEKAPWCNERNLLTALDESWLIRHWRDILRTPRGVMTAAAMAADDRERVATRGARVIRKTFPWQITSRSTAANASVATIFTPPLDPPVSRNDKTIPRQLEQATASVKRLKEENRCQNAQLLHANQALEKAQKTHRREIKDIQTRLAKQTEEAEILAQQRVAAYRASLFGDVSGMDARRQAMRDMATDQLVKKTEKLLNKQAENDVIFGTRRKLEAERDKLIQLKNSVGEALSDAMHPLPELAALQVELREKIEELNQLLSSEASPASFVSVENLEDCILRANRGKAGVELLQAAETVLNNPLGEQLFSSSQRDTLRRTIEKRRDWLKLLDRESVLARTTPPQSTVKSAPKQLFNVRAALKTAPSLPLLVVDGYNVIKNPAFPHSMEKEDQSAARDYLVKTMSNFLETFAAIRIVYDGTSQLTSVEKKWGVEVVFARLRGEDQQADDEIVDWLSKRSSSLPAWLVTNDNGLRSRATPFCETFIAVEDFIDYFRGV